MTTVDPLAPPPGERVASLPANSVTVPTTDTPSGTDDTNNQFLQDLETAMQPTGDPGTPSGGEGGDKGGAQPSPEGEGEGADTTTQSPDPGTETPPETPPETPGVESGPDTSTPPIEEFVEVAGQKYTPAQLQTLTQLGVWASQLSPGHLQAIDNLFSGQYQLTPVQSPAPNPPGAAVVPGGASTAVASSGTTPPTVIPEFNPDEFDDPNVANAFKALQTQLATVQSYVQSESERRHSEYVAQVRQGISTASQSFQTQYSLTDDEMQSLSLKVQQAQILPALAASRQPDQAMTEALNFVFFQSPEYRQKIIDTQLQSEKQKQVKDTARTSKASAVSGGAASAPRPEVPISTKDGREKAMIAELEAHLNGQTS